MNRYDLNRTAANLQETVLNTSNVNPATFGKLWSYPVDGVIFAQPLYVQNLTINGSKHNVLFIATMNDVVYAFDADKSGPPLWTRDFRTGGATAAPSAWTDVMGNFIGVLSTPVIDLPSNSMYLVAQTVESGNWVYRLHKINILNNTDTSTVLSATARNIIFDPHLENQRPGLVLVNGQVIMAFSARPYDDRPFHGWIMAYDMTTLAQKSVFVATSPQDGAGIWGSGGGPVVDPAGNIYFLTGNGFDNTGYNGTTNFSESLLQMSNADGTLKLKDWFTAYNWSYMDSLDLDLSCNSPMMIPGTSLLAFGSKTADVYVANTNNLGKLTNNNSQLAAFFHVGAGTVAQFSDGDRILGLAYWNRPNPVLYAWPADDRLHSYSVSGTNFTETTSNPITGFGEPGMPISLSANGSQSGSGIVWTTMMSGAGRAVGQPGEIHAFNGENLAQELWSSLMNKSRDDVGSPAKFVIPVVANGRVYVATSINAVQVYGLLPASSGGSITGSGSSSGSNFSLTTEGTADWIHWGDSALNRKASVPAQLSTYKVVGSGAAQTYGNDPRPLSWTDGTPTATGTNNTNGVFINSSGNGFSFTAPADMNSRTITVHVGGWNSGGTLTVHVSDGSAPDFVDTTTPVNGAYDRNYTLAYNAASSGQTITVSWVMTGGTGNVTLNGAALVGGGTGSQGALAGTGTSSMTAANLTVEGTTDWIHFGDSSLNRKAGVSPVLSTYTVVGSGSVLTYSDDHRPLSWSDGTPTANNGGDTNGVYIRNTGNGFSITGPADTTSTTLTVHVGGWNSGGTFTAHLSDGSAADFTETTNLVTGQYDRNYTLTYKAGSAGQTITLKWVMASGTGNVTLNGAALGGTGGGSQGALTGAGTSSVNPASLTAEGTTDWVHWGDSSLNRKAGVSPLLSTYSVVGSGSVMTYPDDLRSLTWSDGTPTASNGGDTNGVFIWNSGNGFSISAPADTTTRTLTVHVGGWNSSGTFTAHLSDGSASDFTDTTTAVSGQYDRNYTLTYKAGSAGQTITLKWVMASGGGNVTLNGAALAGASVGQGSLSGIGTSSATTASLTSEGVKDWIHWGDSSLNRKAGVSALLSTYSVIGSGSVLTYSNDPRPLSWTDGTPTASNGGDTNGVFIWNTGNGFSITAPADTTTRTLTVHVGGWNSGGTLAAHLSDGSAPDFSDTTGTASGPYDRNYTLTYHALSSGKTISVTWTMASGSGNVTINGAALQ